MQHSLFALSITLVCSWLSADFTTANERSISLDKNGLKELTLMTFNVQNLFDTEDAPNKADETWLPLRLKSTKSHKEKCDRVPKTYRSDCLKVDWDTDALQAKLTNIARVIKGSYTRRDGNTLIYGPDVVVLQEVENLQVLKALNKHLPNSDYTAYLIEGEDARGIDQAVLTRLPLAPGKKPHLSYTDCRLPVCGYFGFRGVLELPLALPFGHTMRLFVVHLPSPRNPADLRVLALHHLRNDMRRAQGQGEFAVALGDFNIPRAEKHKLKAIRRTFGNDWIPVESLDCKLCRGTYFYGPDKEWSWLDKILVPQSFINGKAPWLVSSVQIVRVYSQQMSKGGYPRRFRTPRNWGVSDHFPILVTLVANDGTD